MTPPRFTMRHRLIVIMILVVANAVVWVSLLAANQEPSDEAGTDREVTHALRQ